MLTFFACWRRAELRLLAAATGFCAALWHPYAGLTSPLRLMLLIACLYWAVIELGYLLRKARTL